MAKYKGMPKRTVRTQTNRRTGAMRGTMPSMHKATVVKKMVRTGNVR